MAKLTRETRISDTHYAANTEYERTSKVFTRNMVPVERKLRILDVGCGTGLNADRLAAQGHTVVGIDVSPVAIAQFKQKGYEGHVLDIAGDNANATLAPESFDAIFASEVIEHVVDTNAFLANLARVLKSDGMLILSTPNSAFWAYRIVEALGQTASEAQHPGHVRFFSKRSLVNAIHAAGFNIDTVAARHMYFICGSTFGDPFAPLMKLLGFKIEPRFATGGHFWQLGGFARKASGFWADTLIVLAHKRPQQNGNSAH